MEFAHGVSSRRLKDVNASDAVVIRLQFLAALLIVLGFLNWWSTTHINGRINLSRSFELGDNVLTVTVGVKNLTDEYQEDLDRGPDRDSHLPSGLIELLPWSSLDSPLHEPPLPRRNP